MTQATAARKSAMGRAVAAAGLTLADTLRQAIRLDIVRGRLAPGTPLRTQTLCEEYGCSLAPLREALSWLTADGLATTESQRGFRVATISKAEWRDIIHRRMDLETKALALSIRYGDDAWEGDIVRCAHEYALASQRLIHRQAVLDETWEAPHRALHLALLAGCRSPWLLRFCCALYDHSDRYRRLSHPPTEAMRHLTTSENALVAAVLARQRALAQRLLREHIREIGDEIMASATLWDMEQASAIAPPRNAGRPAPLARMHAP